MWIFDLHRVAPAAVPQALAVHFAPTVITRTPIGGLVVCYRAVKAPSSDGIAA